MQTATTFAPDQILFGQLVWDGDEETMCARGTLAELIADATDPGTDADHLYVRPYGLGKPAKFVEIPLPHKA